MLYLIPLCSTINRHGALTLTHLPFSHTSPPAHSTPFPHPSQPVMDGPTATQHIRALGYAGQIFGVTGNALQSDVDVFMRAGATAVLPKPLDMARFRASLRPLGEG